MKLTPLTKAWFDVPEDPDETAFEIKHLRAGEISKIVEATHKQRFEFRPDESGELQPVPVLETDKNRERELTITEAITDWKNVFDEHGEPMECSHGNKLSYAMSFQKNILRPLPSLSRNAGKPWPTASKRRKRSAGETD